MKSHEIESERKRVVDFLSLVFPQEEVTIVSAKIKRGSLFFVLDENSLQHENKIKEFLLSKNLTEYRLQPVTFRFPVTGLSSPPKMKTLALVKTVFPSLPPIGTWPMIFFHVFAIVIILLVQRGYEIITREIDHFSPLSEDSFMTIIVVSILSVLHILGRTLWRDVKKN